MKITPKITISVEGRTVEQLNSAYDAAVKPARDAYDAGALAARLNSGCTCDNPRVRCAVHDAEFSDEELGIL